MKFLPVLMSIFAFATAVTAQTADEIKQLLREKETAAKSDPAALLAAAQWADDQGLVAEARRILQNIIKVAPDHEGANKALGNELVDGKWMNAADAAATRKKAKEAEYRAKGLVEVAGIWVEPKHAADAERGVFRFDGQQVSRAEYESLLAGKVRHKVTGEFIDPADASKADQRLFPVGSEGRWVDEKEADKFHADPARPWILRTRLGVLISTLPLEKLEELQEFVNRGMELVRPLVGMQEPRPSERPTVIVAATDDEFRDLGTRMGDETSAFGAFLSTSGSRVRVPWIGESRPAVCAWHKDWGPYFIKHAAAMAYVAALGQENGADFPNWFVHGLGSFTSRFEDPGTAAFFGKQHAQKGGVGDVAKWFGSFAINGNMESKEIDFNVFQAGLVFAFATQGRDEKVTAAMLAVSKAFTERNKEAIGAAISGLRSAIEASAEPFRQHLQAVIEKG